MKFRCTLFVFLFFLSIEAISQTINRPDGAVPIAEFNATPSGGTYTIPDKNGANNITQVLVRIWGGGANGKTSGTNKSGGGGGAFVSFVIPASRLSVSRTLDITVGGREEVSTVVHGGVSFRANRGNSSNNNGGIASSNPDSRYSEFVSYAGGDGYGLSSIGAGGGSGKLNNAGGNGGSNLAGGEGEKAGFGTGGTGSSTGAGTDGTFPGGGGAGNRLAAGGAVYIYDYSTGAILPVTLSSFTAKQTTDNNVSLAWVTSSESVNKGFSIERQEESGGKFQSLGFIPSKAEGGNSQTTLAYSFKDVTAKKGTNMYRLVQEDIDGKKTYSEVRVVKLSVQSVSNVYPNPSNGAINISRTNDGKKMNLQVLDQSGRVISQVNNITDANYRMNISQSGIYSIKMMYPESGEQSIQRIVVQK
jgi:hypothetical protein